MSSKWMTHQGKEILYADYSNIGENSAALTKAVAEVNAMAQGRHGGDILLLINVNDLVGTTENLDILKSNASEHKHLYKKNAVVGVHGYRKILLRAVTTFSKMTLTPFDDEESALNWLVE